MRASKRRNLISAFSFPVFLLLLARQTRMSVVLLLPQSVLSPPEPRNVNNVREYPDMIDTIYHARQTLNIRLGRALTEHLITPCHGWLRWIATVYEGGGVKLLRVLQSGRRVYGLL